MQADQMQITSISKCSAVGHAYARQDYYMHVIMQLIHLGIALILWFQAGW
jgi:hypothetical protein